jgi:uroporphyrinogen-III decarboxylase
MNRHYYLDLARQGLRMPIGTHLVLHRHADAGAIVLDGERLGAVVVETARRFSTPLALPLMDLTLEKTALLLACGIPAAEVESWRFTHPTSQPASIALTPRMEATCQAISQVATQPGLLPMGMGIGPFSLMTKLISDPILPVFLAGAGVAAGDDPEVALMERLLSLSEQVIHRYLQAQIDAGAQALVICEPAANAVYFSPKQQEETGYAAFDRYVIAPMNRIANRLREHDVDLVFTIAANSPRP